METQAQLQTAIDRQAETLVHRLTELLGTVEYQIAQVDRGSPVNISQILRQVASVAEASADHSRLLGEIRYALEFERVAV